MNTITAQEVQQQLEAGKTLNLIDVREAMEVQTGHIPGIINMPLSLLEAKMPELHKQTPYIVLCQAGGRSAQATNFLASYGYDVTNMLGGMNDWQGEVVK